MLSNYDIIRMSSTVKAIRSAEVPRFLVFCVLTLWSKLRRISVPGRLFMLAINGKRFELEVGKGEFDFLYETGIECIYEAAGGFTPDPTDVAVDVGANFGGASIQWHRALTDGVIYAIEPHPDTYKRLRRNIQLNHAGKIIRPFNLAIGRKEGMLPLFITEAGSMALRGPHGEHDSQRIVVPCLTLDAFAEQQHINRIDFLKIDVEGFEHDVLQGAAQILQRTGRIVLEYHSGALKAKCSKVLSEAGFLLTTRNGLIFGTNSLQLADNS